MSKPRVLGRHVTLLVNSSQLLLPIALGEFEEFSATSETDILKRRPMGKTIQAANLRYGGYDLTIKIGKMDPMMERWNHLVERGIFAGNEQPNLFIIEMIQHYDKFFDGHITENWIYQNVVLYGPDKNIGDDYTQSIKGFATHKELGPADISFANLKWAPGIGFQSIVHRTAQTNIDIAGAIGKALSDLNPFD